MYFSENTLGLFASSNADLQRKKRQKSRVWRIAKSPPFPALSIQISRIVPSVSTSSMIFEPSLNAMQNVSQSVSTLISRCAVM